MWHEFFSGRVNLGKICPGPVKLQKPLFFGNGMSNKIATNDFFGPILKMLKLSLQYGRQSECRVCRVYLIPMETSSELF